MVVQVRGHKYRVWHDTRARHEGKDHVAVPRRPHDQWGREHGRGGHGTHGRPADAGQVRRSLPAVLGQRAARQGVLPYRGTLGRGRDRRPQGGARPARRRDLPGRGGFLSATWFSGIPVSERDPAVVDHEVVPPAPPWPRTAATASRWLSFDA